MDHFAVKEYFFYFLGERGAEFSLGGVVWKRILSLAVLRVLIALALCRGIWSYGKVVNVASTLIVPFLVIFLIRSLTLTGASTGLEYLFHPNIDVLYDHTPWVEAATEVSAF